MPIRFKLKFRSANALDAALAIETSEIEPAVINRRRNYMAVRPGPAALTESVPARTEGRVEQEIQTIAREYDAQIVVDYQYSLEQAAPHVLVEVELGAAEASLDEVLDMNRATGAWPTSAGDGVTIAIVDTGVHGAHPEFAPAKRDGGWAPPGDDPWTDWQGHGTMCACIAAGTKAHGGKYNGVAPGARIMSCKTRFSIPNWRRSTMRSRTALKREIQLSQVTASGSKPAPLRLPIRTPTSFPP